MGALSVAPIWEGELQKRVMKLVVAKQSFAHFNV